MHNDMTLDDLKQHDVENLENVMKNCKVYDVTGKTVLEVGLFRANHIKQAMQYAGVEYYDGMPEDLIDKAMKRANVKLENRSYDSEEDQWRSGLYLYKNQEIVAFVSAPLAERPSPMVLNPNPRVVIRTNIRLN